MTTEKILDNSGEWSGFWRLAFPDGYIREGWFGKEDGREYYKYNAFEGVPDALEFAEKYLEPDGNSIKDGL